MMNRPHWICLLIGLMGLGQSAHAQFSYYTSNGGIIISGYDCSGEDAVIPGTINDLPVTGIAHSAFQGCSLLRSVSIPGTITNIGRASFAVCTNLTDVVIPHSVLQLESSVFEGCTSLASLTLSGNLTRLGRRAFHGCHSLTNVTIPASLAVMGDEVFEGCTRLTEIRVDALNSSFSSVDGVLLDNSQTMLIQYPPGKPGDYAIPDGVTAIADKAFYGSPMLLSVSMPNTVTNGGYASFAACSNLTSATISSNITNIKLGMFWRCTSLTHVSMPDSIRTIGEEAFDNCTSLLTVTIPARVTHIEDFAFNECTNLVSIYFLGSTPVLGEEEEGEEEHVFAKADQAIIYYLPGTLNWGPEFGGRPTALWKPEILTGDGTFGVVSSQFGFTVSWADGRSVVVEACSDLENPVWTTVDSNLISGGSYHFIDPATEDHAIRFYRVRMP